jgi:uncharacterized protein with ATP-grasp and redox domains
MPSLSPPNPIRTDESNAFANNTMKVRVPAIIEQTLDLNPQYDKTIKNNLKALKMAVENGDIIRPLNKDSAPDYDEWLEALDKQRSSIGDDPSWHNSEWFFAETYTYRLLIEAVRWHETGHDPFLPKKREELVGDAMWALIEKALSITGTAEEQLMEKVAFALWGNRIDLSYAASMAHGTVIGEDDLLVDDRQALLDSLKQTATTNNSLKCESPIYIICDNAGSELAMDLVLTDFLLEHVTETVYLQVKFHPTFVSDVVPADIWMMLDAMQAQGGSTANLAERLRDYWVNNRLKIVPHPFWNSSLFMWDMPETLYSVLNQARLVIVKGDANYRRVVGDAKWSVDASFTGVTRYLDAPLLCLRTLKSDPIVGLPSLDIETQLDTTDPAWRTNGKRGVIQFKP